MLDDMTSFNWFALSLRCFKSGKNKHYMTKCIFFGKNVLGLLFVRNKLERFLNRFADFGIKLKNLDFN